MEPKVHYLYYINDDADPNEMQVWVVTTKDHRKSYEFWDATFRKEGDALAYCKQKMEK